MMDYDKLEESEREWLQGKRNDARRSQIRTLAAAAILPVVMFLVWRDRRRVVIAVARTLPDDLRQLMKEGRLSLVEAQVITRIRAERRRRRRRRRRWVLVHEAAVARNDLFTWL